MSSTTSHLITGEAAGRIAALRRNLSGRSAVARAAAALVLIGAGAFAAAEISPHGGSINDAPAHEMRSTSLYDQVLKPRELAGFSLQADPATVWAASEWAAAERHANQQHETARLRGLGFEAGMLEPLVHKSFGATRATSIVERFRTATGANTELRYHFARLARRGSHDFDVVGIPGARGVSATSGRGTRLTVLFTSGRDYYLVSATTVANGAGAMTETQVAAAARAQYLRVNGCTARATARPRPV
jgi:hypothetical protein